MKYCTKCDQYLDNSKFSKNQGWCKDCKRKADQKYRKSNQAKKKAKQYRESYASFNTYGYQLEVAESVRDVNGVLEVKCTYCGSWFRPIQLQVRDRLRALNGQTTYNPENRLYCSQECKTECPIYQQKKFPRKMNTRGTSREVNPQYRQLIFERDVWTCQICEKKKSDGVSLHCHHIEPVVDNPLLDCDLNNGLTLCKKCHRNIHKNIPGCKYNELRCDYRV